MAADQILLPRRRRPVPTTSRLATRRVPVVAYAVVLLALPALVVAGAMASGWWSTAGHGGISLSAGGSPGQSRAAGEAEGSSAPAAPADVKGSMTVQQVVEAFPPLTAAEVFEVFGADPGTASDTPLKALVTAGNGTELPNFRTWLERRLAG